MKISLMEVLACPYCKGKLELNVDCADNTEVLLGSLWCAKCATAYPVVDSIPNFLNE